MGSCKLCTYFKPSHPEACKTTGLMCTRLRGVEPSFREAPTADARAALQGP